MTKFTAAIIVACALLTAVPAHAATITVTSLADTSAPGTLRAAINQANTDNANDVITFQNGLVGTIMLTGGLPLIYVNMTIQGPGPQQLVIDGNNNQYRPFNINGGIVGISGLRIQNGGINGDPRGGGAILGFAGAVVVKDCAFDSNKAMSGDSGGAIACSDTMIIAGCTFVNNMGDAEGGAIDVNGAGSATITNCTMTSNQAYSGGAVSVDSGSVAMTNCTVYDNYAEYGPALYTVSANTCTLTNCILDLGVGVVVKQGASVTATNCDIESGVGGATGITDGGGNISAAPLLGGLQFNGGLTETMALAADSPCIGAGTVANAPIYDQRGVSRPNPPAIGAYDPGVVLVVTTLADTSASGTLRTAINTANGLVGATITFQNGLTGAITLTSSLPAITAQMDIVGNGTSIIDGHTKQFRPFLMNAPGDTVNMSDVTVQNAGATQGGAVEVDAGTLNVTGCTLTNCTATSGDGGGVYVSSGARFNMNTSTITHCTAASGYGGAMWINSPSGSAQLIGCSISSNSANFGGGISNRGSLTAAQCLIQQNSATAGNGGGIESAFNAPTNLFSTTMLGNSATGGGGAIECYQSALTASNCTIFSNQAGGGGGINYGSVTLTNTIVYGDTGGEIENCTGTASYCDIQGGIAGVAGVTNGGGNINAYPLVTEGNYGGPTITLALLPGSPCLGAGTNPNFFVPVDQRGVAIPQNGRYDIGAFESSGFIVTPTGGTPQSATINTTFPAALTAIVTAINPAEPVGGGTVLFTVPQTGASALINGDPATIGGGQVAGVLHANDTLGAVSVTAMANTVAGGPYNVLASTRAGSVNFSLTNLADAPTANSQTVSVPFNTATSVTLTGVDQHVPPEALTYTVTGQPTHGTLTGTAPNLTYTPNAGYNGADTMTFTVTDTSNVISPPGTVTLNVGPGVPTANAQTVAVPFHTATAVTLTGSDPDIPAETLTFNLVTQPAHGVLTGSAPNLTYTPNAGFNGDDHFSFTVTNTSSKTSAVATVTLTVAAGKPVANAQSLNVPHDTAKSITLTGSDPNLPAQPLTYAVTVQPHLGTLSGTAPHLTYTPNAGSYGTESFMFTATNTSGVTSDPAQVTMTIAAAKPVANPQTVNLASNAPTQIMLVATDPNTPTQKLSYTITLHPAHGTLSGNAPNLTYTPNAGASGVDSFVFTVTNTSHLTSTPAKVTINFATTAPPIANPQSVNVAFNTASSITLTGSDPNVPAQALTYAVTVQPTLGTLTGNAPNLTYTPNAGASGPDSFTFTVTDTSNLTSAPATVTITIASGAPTANPQSVNVPFNTPTVITLTGADPNVPPQALTYAVVTQPTSGTLSGTAPNLTYMPNSGASGADSFTFTVTNTSSLTSTPATVSITIAGPAHVFAPGIQMISVPTNYANQPLSAVLGYPSPVLAAWQPSTDMYAVTPNPPADALRVGQGYWVRIPAAGASITTFGVAAPSHFTVALMPGWNMIGCPSPTPVALSTVTVTDSSSVTHTYAQASGGLINDPLYTFQSGDTAYEVVHGATDSLQPYYGYWMFAFQPCTLNFP